MEGDATFETHIASGDVVFGARDAALLRAIDEHGSLNRAADALGRSFAHAQRRVVELEEAFGPLVERRRGGPGGGGSELTSVAAALLGRFERLRAEFTGVAEAGETVLRGRVIERDGELATVETTAGRIRALVPEDVTDVQAVIRADAVTLHAPDETPEPDGTSARNRFEGRVVSIDRGEAVASVDIDVGAETHLAALLTVTSIERLELAPGSEVVTTFKATATRGIPDG